MTLLPYQTKQVTTAWDRIKTNWFISLVHKFVIALFFLSLVFLAWRWPLLPPLVPLWFSRPWGTDQLASPYWLILLPMTSMLWYGINFLVTMSITADYLIFTQMLYVSSLIVSILSFITLVKILFLIT